MPKGETQLILKYEDEKADEAFDSNGIVVPIPEQRDDNVSLFVEHGLTSRITLQGKLGWTRGSDLFGSWRGRGPVELGARYALFKGKRTVVTVYAGGVLAGEGRNAPNAPPGAGKADVEVRLLAGRSGELWKHHLFAEAQVARLARDGLPDEIRVETTVGVSPRRNWLLLAQTYAGRVDAGADSPMWLKGEWTVLRDLGPWRVQAGWRTTQMGIDCPVTKGPVLALWRTF